MAAETQFCLKKRQKHESYFNVCLLGEPNNFPCEIMVKIEALVFMLIIFIQTTQLSPFKDDHINSVGDHCAAIYLMFPGTDAFEGVIFFFSLTQCFSSKEPNDGQAYILLFTSSQ